MIGSFAFRLADDEDVDHMLAVIGKKLEINPADWEAWAAKADILYSIGMYQAAILCCDRSLTPNPDNAFTWVTKGNALDKLGRREEASRCYNRAGELEPSFIKQKE